MILTSTRWKHFAAMALIGDGVMAVVHPHRDARAWTKGPTPWRQFMAALERRPALTRLIGATQIAAGIYWAIAHEEQK